MFGCPIEKLMKECIQDRDKNNRELYRQLIMAFHMWHLITIEELEKYGNQETKILKEGSLSRDQPAGPIQEESNE